MEQIIDDFPYKHTEHTETLNSNVSFQKNQNKVTQDNPQTLWVHRPKTCFKELNPITACSDRDCIGFRLSSYNELGDVSGGLETDKFDNELPVDLCLRC